MNWGIHEEEGRIVAGGIFWCEDVPDLNDDGPSDLSTTDCLIANALLSLNTADDERTYARVMELLRGRQEAVETLKILVHRTPSYDLPLKWNLLRLLGALEDPAAADFLAGVAIEPVPQATGHNGGSRYDGELRVRTMAIEALLQIAARHKIASESLLRVVAARPVRPILVEALKAASELGLNASVRRLLPADDRRSA